MQHTFDLWQIISGLLTLVLGGGWLTEAVKNRGNSSLKRVDELAAYRKELREDLEKRDTRHCDELRTLDAKHQKELGEIRELFTQYREKTDKDIQALQEENRLLRESEKKQNEQLETVDRELFEERINRQQLEDRVLFMIQYRLTDKEAWTALADELIAIKKNRKPRPPRKGASETSASPLVGQETHPRRILVVDDHPDTRNVLKILLEQRGAYQVELATNGAEALTLNSNAVSRFSPFHAIISDVNMPTLDGIEMAKVLLSQNVPQSGVKLVLFTADPQRVKDAKDSLDGVVLWEKPLDGDEILAKMTELWK